METLSSQHFLDEIRNYYRSRQSNQIILAGNIWDIYAHPDKKETYLTLPELLAALLADKMILITFDITKGIHFFREDEGQAVEDLYVAFGSARSTEHERRRWFIQRMQDSMVYPILALNLLKEISNVIRTYRSSENKDFELLKRKPLCIICRYAETLLPAGPLDRLSDSDRQKVTIIREWFSERSFAESSDLVILISDTLAEINQKIKDLPRVSTIVIPYPDIDERKKYIRLLYREHKESLSLQESQKTLAFMTAGLRLNGIEDIFLEAAHWQDKIDRNAVINKVNQVLTRQIGDHIEIIKQAQTLKDVFGNTLLKKKLSDLKKRLKSFDPKVVPSGILVSGSNGVGKTFIFTALATESERIPVILKNLRSKWFGETDSIFEKINHVLRALGNVLILVDEADTAFGGRGEQSHETEQRLFGNILKMMSDTQNRGKIVWILLTARPDKLEPDFKRAGRCGLHIPVFDPTGKDREEFFDFTLGGAGLSVKDFSQEELPRLEALTSFYSGADFKELSSELLALQRLAGKKLTPAEALTFIEDWQPTDISEKRRLQTLHAVLHCSYKSLLPPEFQTISRDDILKEINRYDQC